ncbi:MAG: hypothetical protein ABFR63_08980 [Thermodesulfobacteriota bacterium]
MEFASIDNEIGAAHRERTEDLSLDLVSELLAAILADQDEEIQVYAKSQNFLYSPQSSIKGSDTLKVTVEKSSTSTRESEVEFNLAGTVENQLGEKENCALYFFMWWDPTRVSPLKNINEITLQDASLSINAGNPPTPLSDAVFELDLHRKELFKQQTFLGQGRGYLVFGRDS